MDELQAALENIDSPEHLPTCINPLVIIAQNYHPVSSCLWVCFFCSNSKLIRISTLLVPRFRYFTSIHLIQKKEVL